MSNEVIVTCYGLERLFGFLIGFRGRPPAFNVWLNKTYKCGDYELPFDGTLNLGSIDWNEGEAPHPMACVHLNGMGAASIQTILTKFIPNQDDIVTRIHAVEFSRLFSNNLNDRFAFVMPILESYITAKYTEDDEHTYIDSEKKFFEWVESAQDNDILEFSRKHVEVKDKKSPSLTTLLSRAIDSINAYGFSFPTSMAERLKRRRGRMFHSAPQMSEQDVREFFDEIRAATGLLMLHTYLDLGIDISSLADRYFALSDLRGFFVRPSKDD